MKLEGIMMNEIRLYRQKKQVKHDLIYTWNLKQTKNQAQRYRELSELGVGIGS